MIAPYFPSILVPIIGIFLPGIAMAALFIYIEQESVEWCYTPHFFFYKEEPSLLEIQKYCEKKSVEWLSTQHFFFFYKEEPNPE